MKRFNASSVKMSRHLVALPEKTKAANRAAYKKAVSLEFGEGVDNAEKRAKRADKYAEATPLNGRVVRFHKAGSRSGCRLNPAIREALKVQAKLHAAKRAAFFDGLRG